MSGERVGRAAAGKQAARPGQDGSEAEPMVALAVTGAVTGALGVLALTGVLPALACATILPIMDAAPGWAAVLALCALALGAAAWALRGLR